MTEILRASYLEMMRAHVDEGGKLSHQNGVHLLAEVERLNLILNSPIVEPFVNAAIAEARHQAYRWGEDHDAKKTAWDWFWALGYLGGKAAHSALAADWHKAKHHTVTAAALLANWHVQIVGAEQLSDTQRPEKGS
jgi:hypothetical protein